jgi:hypothetical protein
MRKAGSCRSEDMADLELTLAMVDLEPALAMAAAGLSVQGRQQGHRGTFARLSFGKILRARVNGDCGSLFSKET